MQTTKTKILILLILSLMKTVMMNRCAKVECAADPTKPCKYLITKDFHKYIYLNTKACDYETEYCLDTRITPKEDLISLAKCKSKKELEMQSFSLPGEKCSEKSKCRFVECKDGMCPSIPPNGSCIEPYDCAVGYYCEETKTGKSCSPQLKKDAKCSIGTDCQNDLLCVDKKCTELLSLEASEFIVFGNDDINRLLCKKGYSLGNLGSKYKYKRCLKYAYQDASKSGALVDFKYCDPISNDCAFFEVRNNTRGQQVVEFAGRKECECKLNKDGRSFCPKLNNDDNFEILVNFILDNNKECNTFNRFRCFRKDPELYKRFRELLRKTYLSDEFFNTPDCGFDDFDYFNYNFLHYLE